MERVLIKWKLAICDIPKSKVEIKNQSVCVWIKRGIFLDIMESDTPHRNVV